MKLLLRALVAGILAFFIAKFLFLRGRDLSDGEREAFSWIIAAGAFIGVLVLTWKDRHESRGIRNRLLLRPRESEEDFRARFRPADQDLAVRIREVMAEYLEVEPENIRALDDFKKIGEWALVERPIIEKVLEVLIPPSPQGRTVEIVVPAQKSIFGLLESIRRMALQLGCRLP